jgi:hypothetical protein
MMGEWLKPSALKLSIQAALIQAAAGAATRAGAAAAVE